ncbi:triacylglycerol lipase [Moraxellaceae bacterium AER2_44_116]|nr:triacylglycerol lipase [Moraxellaceae bacterium]TQC98224.1 triacylglycerol lipase [Moraxellaceae bacterium AER2_44_116]
MCLLLLSGASIASTAAYQFCTINGCSQEVAFSSYSTYAKTTYPIVLAQGLAGSHNTNSNQYFYGIAKDLAANGARVYETEVVGMNSSEQRGEQLLAQVQQVLAISGAQKVNLIAHSQGGLDSRYVASIIPTKIASITSVGSPHKGTPIADLISKASTLPIIGSVLTPVISNAIDSFFSLMDMTEGLHYDQQSLASLSSLSSAGAAAFNVRHPQGIPLTACGEGSYTANGIRLYSWSGTGIMTNLVDPSDILFAATSLLISGESDGIVPRCSSHFGQVIRDNYNLNHDDEVNATYGLVSWFTDPVTIYRTQANRLKLAGL